ncbi:hypothetical protein K470DRAFT_256918 [Piedraia hortae CBS 480.64]|uniref:Uncharacterized protein n=1 Tax=Piedraia hortae CBS 480.64 TaxID=1314780 RepID=A0A6A7C3D7_9PEZI|nr:hypothetical protein K470DRAFT_256918 [Piedraia hortae CBS 480.64]
MPKRRRERDRPKAHPNTGYNPSKRVLLKYGSSSPSSEGEVTSPPDAKELVNYNIEEYPSSPSAEDEGDSINKIGGEGLGDGDDAEEGAKYCDGEGDQDADKEGKFIPPPPKPLRDRLTGQIPALASPLSDDEDEEDEAVQYLLSVKRERDALPLVLRLPEGGLPANELPRGRLPENGLPDSQPHLEEDLPEEELPNAKATRPDAHPSPEDEQEDRASAKEAFKTRILSLFARARNHTATVSAGRVCEELSAIFSPDETPEGKCHEGALPSPFSNHHSEDGGDEYPAQDGLNPAKIWGLLLLIDPARLIPDDTFSLRQVAKRAGNLGREAGEEVRAVCDVTIIVVGEVCGQRDLLGLRGGLWP